MFYGYTSDQVCCIVQIFISLLNFVVAWYVSFWSVNLTLLFGFVNFFVVQTFFALYTFEHMLLNVYTYKICYMFLVNWAIYVVILFMFSNPFVIKSILSDSDTTWPVFLSSVFLIYLFHKFYIKFCVCPFKFCVPTPSDVSLANSRVVFYFLIQSDNICIVTRKWSPFTLIVINVIFGFIFSIL